MDGWMKKLLLEFGASSQGSAVLYMRPHGLGSLRVATENRRCTSELPLTGSSAKGSVGQN